MNTTRTSNHRLRLEFIDEERKFFRKLLVLIENMLLTSNLTIEEYDNTFGADADKPEEIAELFKIRGAVVLDYSAELIEILGKATVVSLKSSYFEGRFKLLLGLDEYQAKVLLKELNEAKILGEQS